MLVRMCSSSSAVMDGCLPGIRECPMHASPALLWEGRHRCKPRDAPQRGDGAEHIEHAWPAWSCEQRTGTHACTAPQADAAEPSADEIGSHGAGEGACARVMGATTCAARTRLHNTEHHGLVARRAPAAQQRVHRRERHALRTAVQLHACMWRRIGRTSARPVTTRRAMSAAELCAATGTSSVSSAVPRMPRPNTHLPPYRVASQPPGSCVTMYPK